MEYAHALGWFLALAPYDGGTREQNQGAVTVCASSYSLWPMSLCMLKMLTRARKNYESQEMAGGFGPGAEAADADGGFAGGGV